MQWQNAKNFLFFAYIVKKMQKIVHFVLFCANFSHKNAIFQLF